MISERQLKRYCCGDGKDIENYDAAIADTTRKWVIHHRLELTEDGEFQYSMEDLIEKGWYYDRPSSELIFLTKSEHMRIHSKGRSDATREKLSKAQKGVPKTAEHSVNIGKASKGRKRTKGSLGMHWYNNGIENKLTYDCPEGFVKGRLKYW